MDSAQLELRLRGAWGPMQRSGLMEQTIKAVGGGIGNRAGIIGRGRGDITGVGLPGQQVGGGQHLIKLPGGAIPGQHNPLARHRRRLQHG